MDENESHTEISEDNLASRNTASNFPETDLDEELDVSNEKLKKISEAWAARNPQRRSAGGIEDYLDPKTLQHLEELKLINPQPPPDFMMKPRHQEEKEYAGSDCFQISEISKQVHLAALTSYENKINNLTNRLRQVKQERDRLRTDQIQWESERQRMQKDFEEKLQSQTMRITELQSVIAELTRKLNKVNNDRIIEEDEEIIDEETEDEVRQQNIDDNDEDEDARSRSTSDLEVQGSHADCSDCSCENCNQYEDEGPNQVNFMATTGVKNQEDSLENIMANENGNKTSALEVNDDIQKQLSRVLGALESRLEDRKAIKEEYDKIDNEEQTEKQYNEASLQQKLIEEYTFKETKFRTQMNSLLKLVEALKKEKRVLEKQLHNMNVQGYVYQKGNTAHVEDEFNKIRQENNYLRSKLKKSEQELEDTRGSLIIAREEKERIKKKARSFQESLGGKVSPVPSNGSTGSGHRRSNSTNIDHRPGSPTLAASLQRSSSSMVERPPQTQRSNSIGQSSSTNRSPLPYRKLMDRKFSGSTINSNTVPQGQSSSFNSLNSKGYYVSPEGTLNRHHADTSDLGSSVGDETYRNELHRSVHQHLHSRVPEALLQSLLSLNTIDQVLKLTTDHFLAEVDETARAGEINVERVESRMANLQSQNDLLQLSLEESRQNAERLSLLCGKYESNSTAWSLALQNTENLIETYEVLLQLQESEADIFAANCQAAGISGNFDTIKSLTSTKSSISNISIASSHASESAHHFGEDDELYKNHQVKRKDAESHAKLLLHKLDKKFEHSVGESVHEIDLKSDESSYQSRTSTGSSQNSANTDALSKDEELRLRDYVHILKKERNTCKGTVIELESVHEYADLSDREKSNAPPHVERANGLNIDLDTAVLMQEMQALKEERAELKHRIYLLEKEKRSLELKINSRDAQEQAYIVHIEHLKSEVKEQIKKRKQLMKDGTRKVADDEHSVTSSSTHSTNPELSQGGSYEDIPSDLVEATKRERKLKQKIKELLDTLEKLSQNSAKRQRETAEYISDLKRANGALVTAYEKAKKKHASKLKKFEQQLMQMAEKYQHQMRTLKEQIAVLRETPPAVTQTETSL